MSIENDTPVLEEQDVLPLEAEQENEEQEIEQVTDDSEEIEIIVGAEQDGEEKTTHEENAEPEQETGLLKHLRKELRQAQKELKKVKQQQTQQAAEKVQLGPKPKIDDQDIDYDAEKLEEKLDAWYQNKVKFEEQERANQEIQRKQNEAWQAKVNDYEVKKRSLKAKIDDFDEYEDVVRDTFSDIQQAVILQAAKDSAVVVAALGMKKEAANKLKAIANPIEFAVAIRDFERDEIKVTKKKPVTRAEERLAGTATISGTHSNEEKRLFEAAYKSGDWSKYNQYKYEQRVNKHG